MNERQLSELDRARLALAAGFCKGLSLGGRIRDLSVQEKGLLDLASRICAMHAGVDLTRYERPNKKTRSN